MNTALIQWGTIFTIIHTCITTFISIIPYSKKNDSMRIYYHDSPAYIMFFSEMMLGLSILLISKNVLFQIFLLTIFQLFLYYPISFVDVLIDKYDYLHLYKRYFEDNKHFIGFIPLMVSFIIYPIIKSDHNSMYALASLFIFTKLITSYEDL